MAAVVAQILVDSRGEQAALGVFQAIAGYYRATLALGVAADSAESKVAAQDRGQVRLDAPDRARLVDRLVEVFDPETFADMLRHRLQRRVEAISGSTTFPALVDDVVRRADAQGWLVDLVSAASAARRGDAELARIAREAGVGHAGRPELEAIVAQHPQVMLQELERRLAVIEPRICRLEREGRLLATGFLIGPDLVVSADISQLGESGIRALFDRILHPGSKSAAAGSAPAARPIAVRKLIDRALPMGLSLLRLDVPLGVLPVGAVEAAESAAELRGWIEPADTPPNTDTSLLLVHQANVSGAVIQTGRLLSTLPGLLRYEIEAQPGSAGAPLFDVNMRLAGMHIGPERGGPSFGIAASMLWQEVRKLVPPEELRELR